MNSPTRLGQCILSLSLFTRRGENWRFSRSFVDAPVGAGALSAGNLSLSIALLDETDRAAHIDDVGNVLRPQQQHNCSFHPLPPRADLFEIAPLAGLNELIERLYLALQATIVPPVPVLRESERAYRLIETDATVHSVLHGRVFVRQHRGELLDVRARRYVAMRRQDGVNAHDGDLVEDLDPVVHRRRERHVGHAVSGEGAGREQHARMRKRDEGVPCLLARSEIEKADLPSPEMDRHLAVKRCVGQYELYLSRVIAAAFEALNAPRHFLWLNLLHESRRFLMSDEGRTQFLKYEIPHVVVAMEMTVDDPFNRLVGHFADAIEEVAPLARVRSCVDHQHAIRGDQEHRIRPVEVEEEIDVACHLFDSNIARRAFLPDRRQPRQEDAGKRDQSWNDPGQAGGPCASQRAANRIPASQCHLSFLPYRRGAISHIVLAVACPLPGPKIARPPSRSQPTNPMAAP